MRAKTFGAADRKGRHGVLTGHGGFARGETRPTRQVGSICRAAMMTLQKSRRPCLSADRQPVVVTRRVPAPDGA